MSQLQLGGASDNVKTPIADTGLSYIAGLIGDTP